MNKREKSPCVEPLESRRLLSGGIVAATTPPRPVPPSHGTAVVTPASVAPGPKPIVK